MILGMTTFTFVHGVISLVGILSGLVVLFGLIAGKRLDGWTALFLITTVATSVTGFMFPFHKLLPSHVVGAYRSWCWRLPSSRATAVTSPAAGAGPT